MADSKSFLLLVAMLNGFSTCYEISEDNMSKRPGLRRNPDKCIMEHCLSTFTVCMQNSDCRDNMLCVTRCGGSNDTCLLGCVNTYENRLFDKLIQCIVRDYRCQQLQSPDPTFRCSKPNQVLLNFNMSLFDGPWFVSFGLNKQYDCYDCQVSTFTPTPNSKNYTLTGRYDVTTINGSVRHRVDVQQLEQKNAVFGGLLDNTNNVMGLKINEKWQVIDYSPDGQYTIVYYCGNMTADWWYEGSLVFTRQPVLDPKYVSNVTRTLETMGRTIDQYCMKNNTGCTTDHPYQIIY